MGFVMFIVGIKVPHMLMGVGALSRLVATAMVSAVE